MGIIFRGRSQNLQNLVPLKITLFTLQAFDSKKGQKLIKVKDKHF